LASSCLVSVSTCSGVYIYVRYSKLSNLGGDRLQFLFSAPPSPVFGAMVIQVLLTWTLHFQVETIPP